jgi:hypothetical protein
MIQAEMIAHLIYEFLEAEQIKYAVRLKGTYASDLRDGEWALIPPKAAVTRVREDDATIC